MYLNRRVFVMYETLGIIESNMETPGKDHYYGELLHTVELQWLEHRWDHGNLFETWVVRAIEG